MLQLGLQATSWLVGARALSLTGRAIRHSTDVQYDLQGVQQRAACEVCAGPRVRGQCMNPMNGWVGEYSNASPSALWYLITYNQLKSERFAQRMSGRHAVWAA